MKRHGETKRSRFLASSLPKRCSERHFFFLKDIFFLMVLNVLGLEKYFETVTNLWIKIMDNENWMNTKNYLSPGDAKANEILLQFSTRL